MQTSGACSRSNRSWESSRGNWGPRRDGRLSALPRAPWQAREGGGFWRRTAVVPPGLPSNVLRNRGTSPAPPAGAAPPAPYAGGWGRFLTWSLPPSKRGGRKRGLRFSRPQGAHSLIVCALLPEDFLLLPLPGRPGRRGAVTKAVTRHYNAVTEALRESLRSRYQAVTSRYHWFTSRYASWAAQNEPVPYSGMRSGPSLPRTVLPLGLFPQRPCHRGTLHAAPRMLDGEPPGAAILSSAAIMRQAQ